MIDFSNINPSKVGPRGSFEELVCQLARLENFPNDSIFKRVEGAGGDGGVEAYWTKPNGKKTGYQAKYFLRSGDIDWTQIDKSVTQALISHPDLECFIVALPCDLTDKTGKKERGRTGWEHWELHARKWEEEASAAGVKGIKFEAWPSSELIARLIRPKAEGLREFFFGEVHLSIEWFAGKLREVISALDERFHPEDHVDVRIEKLFSVISRDRSCRKELLEALRAIGKWVLPERQLLSLKERPGTAITDCLRDAIGALRDTEDQTNLDPQHEWDRTRWYGLANNLTAMNDELQQWYWKYDKSLGEADSQRNDLRECMKQSRGLEEAVDRLTALLRSPYMDAEKDRLAFIRGTAGSGKSHLLAQCAENAIKNQQPVVLLLGQRLNDSDLWTQISRTLDLPGRSSDQILGAMDAAGKLAGVRSLFLIDAVNEGAGSRYWRNQIASLAHKLKAFPHVCCVVTCRSEYFDLAIPKAIANRHTIFGLRGFETPEEQLKAARVYLDRRGIARPSTPWLSPEFVNPLFLRSVCVSLERDKKSEFPSGLTGTRKILKYYLESLGRNITEKEASTVSLVPKMGRSVRSISAKMLETRKDFLELDICRSVIEAEFRGLSSRTESDWLSVFLNNGILRRDPNPSNEDDFADEDIVRFSFQRFQDFLMAEQSLQGITSPDRLFEKGGPLGFCVKNGRLASEWRGLLDALGVALPEKLKVELIDALPGGESKWWSWSVQQSLIESVKWRERASFTDRTLELLNSLDKSEVFELLLQVAVSADHPWNAEMLHRNLARRKLADRDAFWTTWVNSQSDHVETAVGILIEWCRIGQAPHTSPDNQLLGGLVLCWFFTSSNRAIRDRSTKALTNLLLANEKIFAKLITKFVDVDDAYVLERLLAAAYGSCCRNPNTERLDSYSKLVFELIFKRGDPPFGILLRDYAAGIVELASRRGSLSSGIDLDICKPPYRSKKLRLTVSEKQLKEIATKAGGQEIIHSAASSMGDFSSYEVAPRVRDFLGIPLDKPIPLSSEQKARQFEVDVIGRDRKRMEVYEWLEKTANPYTYGLLPLSFERRPRKPTQRQTAKWREDLALAEAALLNLLSSAETKRFRIDVAPFLYERGNERDDEKKFDLSAMRRWVAKRAYEYGWTRKRFGTDRDLMGHHSRDRPSVERIGKKYQWLALDELLSRLADNYWMRGDSAKRPKSYANPLDLGFERDIDPTIIDEKANHPFVASSFNDWVFEPWIALEHVDEGRLSSWPFKKDPATNLKQMPIRIDSDGVSWTVLFEHQSITEKYGGDHRGLEHGLRMQEFRFLATVMVKAAEAHEIAERFKSDAKVDITHWAIFDATDAAFLHEAPWRDTWNQDKWLFDSWNLPTGVGYAQTITRYAWESHLDAALPEGFSTYLPSPWLARELGLHADLALTGVWRDQNNGVVFREFKGEEGGNCCLIRTDRFEQVLGKEFTPLSVLIAERNAWPGGDNLKAAWRRSEGVCWKEPRRVSAFIWNRDSRNGG